MFRKMRRFKQQLSDDECVRILKNGKTAVLALYGDNGYPYAVPVNYAYADGKIYFHGAGEGHKYDALKSRSEISLCVIERDDVDSEKLTTLYKSVIVFGRAKILENDEEIFRSAEVFGLKYNSDKAAVDKEIERLKSALCCVEVTIEHMTGKQGKELVGA
ncbi:MAG: pyridoxamine 5'-phosphate oxidase family protein [Firmicutes bacterium]|nr:pyridoxamine 5'-phosphate oxidase family protein [Bacillota bacterium]